jgi:hypothetical protein
LARTAALAAALFAADFTVLLTVFAGIPGALKFRICRTIGAKAKQPY